MNSDKIKYQPPKDGENFKNSYEDEDNDVGQCPVFIKSDKMPWGPLLILCVVNFTSSLEVSGLFSYLSFMVVDMKLVSTVDKAGYYTGIIASSLYLGRLCTSYFWGYMADIYGRKPILGMAIFCLSLFSILFGLSKTLWMAILSRFFMGLTNPILAVGYSVVSELCTKEQESTGMALIQGFWSVGLIFGPALGAYLAKPVSQYPSSFSENGPFKTFPYLLPNLVVGAMAFIVFIIFIIFFPETLPRDGTLNLRRNNGLSVAEIWSLPNVVAIISCYFTLSLGATIFDEVYPLWSVCSYADGGLDFRARVFANVQSTSGAFMIVFMFLIAPKLNKRIGHKTSFIGGAILSAVSLFLFPCLHYYSKNFSVRYLVVTCYVIVKMALTIAFMGCTLLLNHQVPTEQRASVTGMNILMGSLAKSLAPVGGTSIFAWSANSGLPFPLNFHLTFVIMGLTGVIAACISICCLSETPITALVSAEACEKEPLLGYSNQQSDSSNLTVMATASSYNPISSELDDSSVDV